jgi:hypothetical protein
VFVGSFLSPLPQWDCCESRLRWHSCDELDAPGADFVTNLCIRWTSVA